MQGDLRVNDVDFVVPCTWEGTRDQLHISDPHATKHGHPGRLFSGTACLALIVAHEAARSYWQPPRELTWRFDAPLYLNDLIQYDIGRGAGPIIQVSVRTASTEVAAGTMTEQPEAAIQIPAYDGLVENLSRTLGEGDTMLFKWWLTQNLGSVAIPTGITPWPLLLLTTSGFVANLNQFTERDVSPVLRAYKWQFERSLAIMETIAIELRAVHQRASKTKPGWTVWTGYLNLSSLTRGDTVARSEFTILCEGLLSARE